MSNKHVIKFGFAMPGTYECTLVSARLSLNNWTKGLQYHFEFELTHKCDEFGFGAKLVEPIKYERVIRATRDNEPLHRFLQMLEWPELNTSDFAVEIDHMNNIIIPPKLCRVYRIVLTEGSAKNAQFNSIAPMLTAEQLEQLCNEQRERHQRNTN